ncbi:MAG: hypothetical protein IKP37_02600 [Paludibacteraceae bacterium]|nr:hypothetical protein [Paludibacteraceae bacterium]
MTIFEKKSHKIRMKISAHIGKAIIGLGTALTATLNVQAQEGNGYTPDTQRLAALFETLRNSDSDSLSNVVSQQIGQELGLLLQNDSTFDYRFEELANMGKCYSDDKELRIYTWNYPLSDKTYGYGGFLQLKPNKKRTKQKVKPIPLKIKGNSYTPGTGSRIGTDNWYGALYYNAIKAKKDGNEYYILLGWGGGDALTDFKVAETLKLSKNEKTATFGSVSPFKGAGKTSNRIVLQYNNEARVALNYDKDNKRIVMDHLSPSEPFYKGLYSYYGPDFTYDAYQFDKKSKGQWILIENIDAKNSE